MTDEELAKIQRETAARVRVSCDEYHAHSAVQDCLMGDERDITILKITETLRRERAVIREATAKIGTPR
jgi:hypothetical protein